MAVVAKVLAEEVKEVKMVVVVIHFEYILDVILWGCCWLERTGAARSSGQDH